MTSTCALRMPLRVTRHTSAVCLDPGQRRHRVQLDATQFRLFEEDTLADAAAIEAELERIVTPKQARIAPTCGCMPAPGTMISRPWSTI